MNRGYLAEDTEINGVTYLGAYLIGTEVFYAPIYFYENGQVRVGRLAGDQTINGVTYRGGTDVNFDENGNVTSGTEA